MLSKPLEVLISEVIIVSEIWPGYFTYCGAPDVTFRKWRLFSLLFI